jgi:hypothetical protein
MQALYPEYSTKDSAFMAIENMVRDFYTSSFPDVLQNRKGEVDAAIAEIQKGYSNNIFPFMKSSWKAYPNHLGHLESDGCYRCHNNKHSTDAGRVISKDCNLCHNIKAQGTPGNMEYAIGDSSLVFKHPVDIGDVWQTELCSSCHSALY